MIRKKVNKCDLSPNGEKFSRLMRDAFENETEYDETRARPVDYSFMDEIPEEPEQSKKRYHFGSATRVAAVILVFSTAVLSTSIWLNSEPANAGKFKLEKIFYQMRNGLFTSDGGGNPNDYLEEEANVLEIDKMADIDTAKKFMPGLLVPAYVPDEYEFDLLEIIKQISGNYFAKYTYETKAGILYVQLQTSMSVEAITDSLVNGNIIEEGDLLMCPWEDKTTDTHGVNAAKGDVGISITGTISIEEMLEVIRNLS